MSERQTNSAWKLLPSNITKTKQMANGAKDNRTELARDYNHPHFSALNSSCFQFFIRSELVRRWNQKRVD